MTTETTRDVQAGEGRLMAVDAALERAKQDRDSSLNAVEQQGKSMVFMAYMAAFTDRAVLAAEVERLTARAEDAERERDALREGIASVTQAWPYDLRPESPYWFLFSMIRDMFEIDPAATTDTTDR